MEPFSLKERTALYFEPAGAQNRVIAGFSLRSGGMSWGNFSSLNLGLHVGDRPENVVMNRRLLGEEAGFPPERWVCAQQVHGTRIARVNESHAGSGALELQSAISETDGLFTTEENLLLALCFADCVPVYFYVNEPAAVGIAHAGWRGTAGGIVSKMVRVLTDELNVRPDAIYAVIGPSIGQNDYEVDQTVMDEMMKLPCLSKGAAKEHGKGHFLLDLKAINRSLLLDAGLPEAHIQVSSFNTCSEPDLFYSFRRDKGKTGRMMGFTGLKKKGV
ncbi:peptidoglycan editing factor PgeF [Sporolactobacillus sp. THM19-2]|jgi:YfiH family protein|uniref:peptidoglycan editing factor PgeF n=1 Tax=Sporolactobacillus sp. THM19-2 TaxID=2511171 RepID=UPI0010224A62|nr:peptidoglycan editing factor PgeF [Sporolactobacillus sp. THM19-2]RYL92882.1 peptidoglycan editing factor PgeF [Sporolactobacillus sp. THM19-2]